MSDDDARAKAQPADDDDHGAEGRTPRSTEPPTEIVVEVDVTPDVVSPTPRDGGDVELLALIDRLAALLDRSDLTELEVEAGGTGLVLRKAVAIAVPAGAPETPASTAPLAPVTVPGEPSTAGRDPATIARPSVKAPLTGIFYASPAPGSAPYVQVGGELAIGQIIGLIEAMKLFNEIKSDLAGRISRVSAQDGALVKARQPLIEVEAQ